VPELGEKEFGVVRTKTGNFAIVPLGPGMYRVAAVEWDQQPVDRNETMSLDELRDAIRRVIGIDLAMTDPVWLSRATDSSRLVDRYREGRVLLAGDAAHVHWAYGGMGLQTGIQDAGNLGWKLAAHIRGWASPELLDTYHTERHPVGERLIMSTRAQQALARPGKHVTALRELFGQLLKQEQTYRIIVEMVTSVEIRYDMGSDGGARHPMAGRWAPNLPLIRERGKTEVAELMHAGRGVLLDLAGRTALHEVAAKWTDSVDAITASCYERPAKLDALLIRPDGYVAWAAGPEESDQECQSGLHAALEKWFGTEGATPQRRGAAGS
jgi:FAD binding domain